MNSTEYDNNLEFSVMPDLPKNNSGEPAVPPPAVKIQPKPSVPEPPKMTPTPPVGKKFKTSWIMAVLAVLVLAAAAYFVYIRFIHEDVPADDGTGSIDIKGGGEALDADKDGLEDEREKKLGTDSKKNDTDGDGLSDGDEVNIYLSDPLLIDTDGDSYDDGQEVANDYSPLLKTTDKVEADEKSAWAENVAKFGMHQPTQNTLTAKISVTPTDEKSHYMNLTYKYSLDLPNIFSYREADNAQKVGIYITGHEPDDDDVLGDPFSISTAVVAGGQTFDEWVSDQYAETEYGKKENKIINSLSAIKLSDIAGDSCTSTKTFFSKVNTVIILTWTCQEISTFGPYYEEIVNSFKF